MQPRTHAKVGEMVINGCTMSFQSTPAIAGVATVSPNIKALSRKMYVPIWGAWVEHEPMNLPEATISKLATSGYDEGSLETKTSYVTLVLVTHPVCIEREKSISWCWMFQNWIPISEEISPCHWKNMAICQYATWWLSQIISGSLPLTNNPFWLSCQQPDINPWLAKWN